MTARGTTLERLERILLLVPWLLEHPGARMADVCERFGTTREELAADLDVLGYCGLPGYGGGDLVEVDIAGDRVTVRMADFFRRPLRLSLREGLALLLAARALAGLPGVAESEALRGAVARLATALGIDPGAVAVDVRAPGDEHIAPLRAAVEARRAVRIRHRSPTRGLVERVVDPWAVLASGGAWLLWGGDRLTGSPRHFRLDRVAAVAVTDEPAATAPGPAPAPRYHPSDDDAEVVLELAPGAWWVAEVVEADDVRDRGRSRRLTFRTGDLPGVARLVLRLGDDARVVAPPALRSGVAELARAALTRYETDPD